MRREKDEPRPTFRCVAVNEGRKCSVANRLTSAAPQEISTCVHDDITRKKMSREDVAAKYKLSQVQVSNLVYKVNNDSYITGVNGRRRAVADWQFEQIKQHIVENMIEETQLTSAEMDDAFNLAAIHNNTIRPGESLSKNTLTALRKRLKATEVIARLLKPTREAAESDPRNFVSLAVAYKVLHKDVDPQLIFNFDATQFKVATKQGKVIIIREELPKGKQVKTKADQGVGMAFFVKYFAIANAAGILGPPVLLVQDKNLDSEAFYHYEMPGGGIGGGPEDMAYVCVCKTRAGNDAFFRFFVEKVLFRFITHIRETYTHLNGHASQQAGKPLRAVVSCDGESKQLSELLKEGDGTLRALAHELNICFLKLPASLSGKLQPCDVMALFMTTRLAIFLMKELTVDNIMQHHGTMYDQLCATLQRERPDGVKKLSGPDSKRIALAVITVCHCLSMKSNADQVRKGFSSTGAYPVSAEATMSCMAATFDHELMQKYEVGLPAFIADFLKRAYVSEDVLVKAGIPRSPIEIKYDEDRAAKNLSVLKPKDLRPINEQRAVFISSDEVLVQLKEQVERAAQAVDKPETMKQLVAAAEKRVKAESAAKIASVVVLVDKLKDRVKGQKKIEKDNKELTATNKRLRAELDAQNKQAAASTTAAKKAKQPDRLHCSSFICTSTVRADNSAAWWHCKLCDIALCNKCKSSQELHMVTHA